MAEPDPYQLTRFVEAQDDGGTYPRAVAELRQGRKVSHWMWFIFPQITGLGRSSMAQRYAIRSLDEARAYLTHPVLGVRLTECATILETLDGASAADVFGSVDALKLHSSMTLFHLAVPDDAVFGAVLRKYYGGELDPGTQSELERL